jgi:DNA-binding NtrC family response regulator
MATILIIEDDVAARELLRDILETEGHQVTEAANGEDGVRRYRPGATDLVVTDILMPKKGGLNVIRDIRAKDPAARIIAMSGGGTDGRLNFLGTARTFDGVLTLPKPFKHTDLLSLVERALEGH